ncbi:MAG: hypothetical protein DMG68_14685 [Acidobacteria bacterium]|jgi:hypothetical protein|nr:MAG: hypothetical protein DMG68_14685 [Acidobacteriota bacterium]
MLRKIAFIVSLLAIICIVPGSVAQQTSPIPAGSKVFIASMDGFETYMKAALEKKNVPLKVVESKDEADFEMTGTSNSQKAGAAKIILFGSWHSREEASINLTNLKTSEVAFAYSVHKQNSAHGKQSSAEACAKHIREKIEGK